VGGEIQWKIPKKQVVVGPFGTWWNSSSIESRTRWFKEPIFVVRSHRRFTKIEVVCDEVVKASKDGIDCSFSEPEQVDL
jgi:hypothetical protein